MTSSIPTNVYSAPHVRHVLQSQKLMQMQKKDRENLLAATTSREKRADNRMVVPQISIGENYDVSRDRRQSCVMESFLQFWPAAMRRPSSPGHVTYESNKGKLSLKMPCRLDVESDDRRRIISPLSAPPVVEQPSLMPSARAKSMDSGQLLSSDEKSPSAVGYPAKNDRFRFFSGQH